MRKVLARYKNLIVRDQHSRQDQVFPRLIDSGSKTHCSALITEEINCHSFFRCMENPGQDTVPDRILCLRVREPKLPSLSSEID